MRFLLTKIDLLDKKIKYKEIKVLKKSKKVEQIKVNAIRQERKASGTLTNTISLASLNAFLLPMQTPTPMSLKEDN